MPWLPVKYVLACSGSILLSAALNGELDNRKPYRTIELLTELTAVAM
jgi:hypothetical protein